MSRKVERLIVEALTAASAQGMYGLDIAKTIQRPAGTIHLSLAKLEARGEVESHWEGDDFPSEGGKNTPAEPDAKPRRRYYRIVPR